MWLRVLKVAEPSLFSEFEIDTGEVSSFLVDWGP
jgi:hypothetical protein